MKGGKNSEVSGLRGDEAPGDESTCTLRVALRGQEEAIEGKS